MRSFKDLSEQSGPTCRRLVCGPSELPSAVRFTDSCSHFSAHPTDESAGPFHSSAFADSPTFDSLTPDLCSVTCRNLHERL